MIQISLVSYGAPGIVVTCGNMFHQGRRSISHKAGKE